MDYIRGLLIFILVSDETQHAGVLHLVDIQGNGAHSYPHHGLGVVEELDGLRVQGEIICVL